MFKEGTIQDRYTEAVYIREKVQRFAKVCAWALMVLYGLLIFIAIFASGIGDTAGGVLLAIVGFPVGYIGGYIWGSTLLWTYYWLEKKFHLGSPVYLTMFVTGFVGLFVWLKYRKYPEKLERSQRGNSPV